MATVLNIYGNYSSAPLKFKLKFKLHHEGATRTARPLRCGSIEDECGPVWYAAALRSPVARDVCGMGAQRGYGRTAHKLV